MDNNPSNINYAITSFFEKGVSYIYKDRKGIKQDNLKVLYHFLFRLMVEHSVYIDIQSCIEYGNFDGIYCYRIVNLNFNKNVSR